MHRLSRPARFWRGALAFIASGALFLGTTGPGLAADEGKIPPPFSFSSVVAEGKHLGFVSLPARGAAEYASAARSTAGALGVGVNVDIIGNADVVQQGIIDGVQVKTCNPGKQTAQNETPIAVNPSDPTNLVAGANDYRLYEASEDRYDGSGGFYRSTNGGKSWSVGFLPGLVRANSAAPGPYESAGDPSIAAGPANTFWYANLVFNRSDNANAVAVSRSTDGGATWTTSFVIRTSAVAGATLFNDKEWVAADPNDPNVAYVTWTQFYSSPGGSVISSPIVLSRTGDGGAHWSAPVVISPFRYNQGSVGQVDPIGRLHIVYEAFSQGHDVIAYTMYDPSSGTTHTEVVARDNDIPSPLPGATFRTNSFPAFALDGNTLHVVWSNWNGRNADVVYTRKTLGGSWSHPVVIGPTAGDQFFPWIGASGGKVFVSWMNRSGTTDSYVEQAAASPDGGATWTSAATVATATSNVTDGNQFGYPNCAASFIGDYTGLAVGSDGVAHPMWTDIRIGNDTSKTADQDPYTATLLLQ